MPHHIYRRHYIKAVVFRIDFPIPIPSIDNSERPAEFQRRVLEVFPIQEETKTYKQMAQFSPAGVQGQSKESILYTFYNSDHTCKIGLDSNFMFIEHTGYQGFENFSNLVTLATNSIFEIWPATVVNRLGLRYVNEITIPSGRDVLDWSGYINGQLLSAIGLYANADNMSRFLVQTEMRSADYFARILAGILNPDYPGIIRKGLFNIDIDIYTNEAVDKQDIRQKVETYHDAVINIFESSITQGLRDFMDAETNA